MSHRTDRSQRERQEGRHHAGDGQQSGGATCSRKRAALTQVQDRASVRRQYSREEARQVLGLASRGDHHDQEDDVGAWQPYGRNPLHIV